MSHANHTQNQIHALSDASQAVAFAKSAHHLSPEDASIRELSHKAQTLYNNIVLTIEQSTPPKNKSWSILRHPQRVAPRTAQRTAAHESAATQLPLNQEEARYYEREEMLTTTDEEEE